MQAPGGESGSTKRFAQKREALLAAASELFNERGVRGVTLADVAERVGLVKNSVTYYYRRKEDLAAACFLRTLEVFITIIESVEGLPTAGERIRELLRLHLQLQARIASGLHAPVMAFRDIRALAEPAVNEVFEAYNAMFRRIRALLKLPATQRLRREELNARAHLVVSLVNRLSQMAAPQGPDESARMLDKLCAVVFDGLCGPRSAWEEHGLEQSWMLGVRGDTPADHFLHAATELINEQGFRGASVTRISERLELTKGAFYYYNANKDDLVGQCFERSFGIIRAALVLAEQGPGTGWQQVCSVVRGLVNFQVSSDGPLLRTSASAALPDPERRAQVTADFGRMREKLTGIIVTGIVDGSIRGADAFLCGHYLLNSIDAAAELKWWVRGASPANAAALYARPLLLGLLCEGDSGATRPD